MVRLHLWSKRPCVRDPFGAVGLRRRVLLGVEVFSALLIMAAKSLIAMGKPLMRIFCSIGRSLTCMCILFALGLLEIKVGIPMVIEFPAFRRLHYKVATARTKGKRDIPPSTCLIHLQPLVGLKTVLSGCDNWSASTSDNDEETFLFSSSYISLHWIVVFLRSPLQHQ